MVYKIRDKTLFWTGCGWKNNYRVKCLNEARNIKATDLAYFMTRFDSNSFLRIYQSYRNYSRLCKQYLYGDKDFEKIVILELRKVFRLPYECETPVQLIKHGPERRMADQLDRDLELVSHNHHPAQLYLYDLQNKHIRDQNEYAKKVQEDGQDLMGKAIEEAMKRQIEYEKAKLGTNEKLSIQKMGEIVLRVSRLLRTGMGEKEVRDEKGEFNDFLEKRRPFLQPNPNMPST